MKSLATLIVLGLVAANASAGEISRSTFASIGLPGFTKISQSDAMGIRGKGYTLSVSGNSWASAGGSGPGGGSGAGSTNSYSASESGKYGSHGASGSNNSFAVGGASIIVGNHASTLVFGAGAGGASSVSVH